jgi:hypothetical protein
MKLILLIISIPFFFITSLKGQSKNIIGYSLGGYMNFVPKYDLPGNQYHPFIMKSSSSYHGFSYERIFDLKNSIQTGAFINQQFTALMSLHFPINYNYCFYQLPFKRFMIGATFGVNVNIPLATSNSLIVGDIARIKYSYINLDFEVNIKKKFYMAPHTGLWTSVRLGKRFGLYMQTLFHYPVSEYVQFITSYDDIEGNRIVEENTNKNFGVTMIAGIQIWVGKIF